MDIRFPNIGISFENVPRVLFSIFGFEIYMYAACIVVGIIAAYYLGIWWVKHSGQKVDDYSDLLMLGIPLAIIGLRAYYLIFNWQNYDGQNFFRVFLNIRDGGLAIYGGIIGSVVAALIVSRRKKNSVRDNRGHRCAVVFVGTSHRTVRKFFQPRSVRRLHK